jgi:hypothetical protein
MLLLVGGSLACWVLVALPARALLTDAETVDRVIVYSGTALLLCTIPSVLTLWWARRSLDQSPDQQLMAVLGGTGLRMFSVLLAGWLLTMQMPYFKHATFWTWLLLAYLFTLALEITLLLVGRTASAPRA